MDNDWNPIETAPHGFNLRIKIGEMTFIAKLECGVSIDESGNECDQWWAINEGEHPSCWTDGACWKSNSDGCQSMYPEFWQFP